MAAFIARKTLARSMRMATDDKSFRKYRLSIDLLDLKPHEKVLLMILEDMVGTNGECWPGMTTLARALGVSKPTIKRSISRLEAIGEIKVTRPPKRSGETNRYRCPNRLVSRVTETLPKRNSRVCETPGRVCETPGRVCETPLVGSVRPPNQTKQPDSLTREENTPLTPHGGNPATRKKPKRDIMAEAEAAMTSDVLRTDAFRELWTQWVKYRKERNSPLTPSTVKRQIHKLERFGHDAAIRSIGKAIDQGWIGFFAPDNRGDAGTQSQDEDPDAKFRALRQG